MQILREYTRRLADSLADENTNLAFSSFPP